MTMLSQIALICCFAMAAGVISEDPVIPSPSKQLGRGCLIEVVIVGVTSLLTLWGSMVQVIPGVLRRSLHQRLQGLPEIPVMAERIAVEPSPTRDIKIYAEHLTSPRQLRSICSISVSYRLSHIVRLPIVITDWYQPEVGTPFAIADLVHLEQLDPNNDKEIVRFGSG